MSHPFRYLQHVVLPVDGAWVVREHDRPGQRTAHHPRPELARLEVERCDRWAICPVGRRRQQAALKRRAEPRIATRPGRRIRR